MVALPSPAGEANQQSRDGTVFGRMLPEFGRPFASGFASPDCVCKRYAPHTRAAHARPYFAPKSDCFVMRVHAEFDRKYQLFCFFFLIVSSYIESEVSFLSWSNFDFSLLRLYSAHSAQMFVHVGSTLLSLNEPTPVAWKTSDLLALIS